MGKEPQMHLGIDSRLIRDFAASLASGQEGVAARVTVLKWREEVSRRDVKARLLPRCVTTTTNLKWPSNQDQRYLAMVSLPLSSIVVPT